MLNQADVLSFSRLNVLTSCAEKYNNQYILKRYHLEPFPDYFSVGGFVDRMLESIKSERIVSFYDFLEENKISFLDQKWFHFCLGMWQDRKK